jgi:hypothetical protein
MSPKVGIKDTVVPAYHWVTPDRANTVCFWVTCFFCPDLITLILIVSTTVLPVHECLLLAAQRFGIYEYNFKVENLLFRSISLKFTVPKYLSQIYCSEVSLLNLLFRSISLKFTVPKYLSQVYCSEVSLSKILLRSISLKFIVPKYLSQIQLEVLSNVKNNVAKIKKPLQLTLTVQSRCHD